MDYINKNSLGRSERNKIEWGTEYDGGGRGMARGRRSLGEGLSEVTPRKPAKVFMKGRRTRGDRQMLRP